MFRKFIKINDFFFVDAGGIDNDKWEPPNVETIIMDYLDPRSKTKYNPIVFINNRKDAETIAKLFLKNCGENPDLLDTEILLLSYLLSYIKLNYSIHSQTFAALASFTSDRIRFGRPDCIENLRGLSMLKQNRKFDMREMHSELIQKKDSIPESFKEIESILSAFVSKEMASISSCTTFNFDDVLDKNVCILCKNFNGLYPSVYLDLIFGQLCELYANKKARDFKIIGYKI